MSAALAKIHIAKKELRLEDDDYRATLLRLVGQDSAKGLTERQAGIVLDEFKRRGWMPKVVSKKPLTRPSATLSPREGRGGKTAAPAQADVAKKARALWISLWQLGVVRDSSEKALEAFAARQLKVERLVWADHGQMYKLVEALKAMATRSGWSQDVSGLHGVHLLKALKAGLVRAQHAKLGRVCPPLDMKSLEQLGDIAADLGQQIRDTL